MEYTYKLCLGTGTGMVCTRLMRALQRACETNLANLFKLSNEESCFLLSMLEESNGVTKVTIAHAIFQICQDKGMIDVVLQETPKVTGEFGLIAIFYLLRTFKDERLLALLDLYRHDKRYLVAYNATRARGEPTEKVVERFRKKRLKATWWQRWIGLK
jgi:hypothetical protein